jgi:LysR family hydrogen peroxide-inducible transcriptional activator
MNFQQLKYVLAVHEHQHFGNAADSCHVTQATLSAMIRKLEEELDLVLFDRSKQPIKTTEEGLEVLTIARTILSQKKELMNLSSLKHSDLHGEIRLGIIPTVANSLLPMVLSTVLKENPKLKLIISEVTTEEILLQLHQDKLDIGLLATPINDQDIEETILYYEPMMLYGVKNKGKKYISGKDVKNSKVWLLEEGNCFRSQSISICNIQEKELDNSNLKFEGSSFDTLLNLTDQFGGYTLIPELYYHSLSNSKKRITKPFINPIPVREISLVRNRPYAKKRAVDRLAETIKTIVNPTLSTYKMKAKDLAIIGI